jgi:hypothetical protein
MECSYLRHCVQSHTARTLAYLGVLVWETNIAPLGLAEYLSSTPGAFLKAARHPIGPNLGIVIKPSHCRVLSLGRA